jgi:hypothetical protein
MYSKEAPEDAPAPLKPWFAIPGPVSSAYSIAFGHWASLEGRGTPEGIYALDTGCCWGGELTCLRWEISSTSAVEPAEKPRRRRSRRVLSLPGWRRVAPYPTFLRFVALAKNSRERPARVTWRKSVAASSTLNSAKKTPVTPDATGVFHCYPSRLTAFEDLKAVAVGVLRVGVMKLAEHRFPLVRIVIREMGIAFHFRIDMGQIELLRFGRNCSYTRPPPITMISSTSPQAAIASTEETHCTRSSLPGLLLITIFLRPGNGRPMDSQVRRPSLPA